MPGDHMPALGKESFGTHTRGNRYCGVDWSGCIVLPTPGPIDVEVGWGSL